MKYRTLLATLTTAAAITGVSAGSADAATSAANEAVSQNWAGYVVGGSDSSTQFSNVSGSWVQPTSKCSSGQDYAAFWVGIGGSGQSSSSGGQSSFGQSSLGDGSSTSLEQIGTQGDCTGNGTQYYAWYELVPAAPVQLNLSIHPGDHITASVNVSGSNTSFKLTDTTTGQSFSKTVSSPNPDTSSAEWIAEAPSQCDGSGNCTPLPLSDFGTVDFTGATATANGHTGSISDSDWTAQPIALGSGGTYDVGYGSGPEQRPARRPRRCPRTARRSRWRGSRTAPGPRPHRRVDRPVATATAATAAAVTATAATRAAMAAIRRRWGLRLWRLR